MDPRLIVKALSMSLKERTVPIRLDYVDALRGIAALCVCLFHFTKGSGLYLSDSSWVKQVGSYGWLGVQSFFIISGYIISFILSEKQFETRQAFLFLWKRMIRLYLPFLASVALCFVPDLLFNHPPYYTYKQLFVQLFFLNNFLNVPLISPVYWTLFIELQFYVLIAIGWNFLNPLKNWNYLAAIICLLCVSSLIDWHNNLPTHLPFFFIGITILKYQQNKIDVKQFLFCLIVLCMAIVYINRKEEPYSYLIAALLSTGLLFFPYRPYKPMAWLGLISYSFYLIHLPIGGRAITVFARINTDETVRTFLCFLDIALMILFSFIFYLVIERPAIKLSKKVGNEKGISD